MSSSHVALILSLESNLSYRLCSSADVSVPRPYHYHNLPGFPDHLITLQRHYTEL